MASSPLKTLRVIVSPAKKMLAGVESPLPLSAPALLDRSRELLDALLAMDVAELQALWRVSDRLLVPCLDTLRELRERGLPGEKAADAVFSPLSSSAASLAATDAVFSLASPAILAYVGIQYQSMAPAVMDAGSLVWLADHLRIISGLYGCLRPFDAVAPYRLEMGARMPAGLGWPGEARDLYAFWGDAIAREVCAAGECDGSTARGCDGAESQRSGDVQVVNLASIEYAKAVLPRLLPEVRVTTCIFAEELQGDKPVQRSTASKAARGSMVRWMAERGVADADELRAFDVGYRLAPELCHEGGAGRTLVFLRA